MIPRVLERSADVSMALACGVLLLLMTHVSADVVLKRVAGSPIPGTLECVTYYYMVGVVFLPLPMVQYLRQQIMVEVFTHSIPRRYIATLDLFVGLICAILLAVITYHAFLVALKATQLGEFVQLAGWNLLVWPSRWFVVLGFALTAALFLLQSLEGARSVFSRVSE